MEEERKLQQLKKRLLELAQRSYEHGVYTFTSFLGMSEQQVFYEIKNEVAYAGFAMEGGSPLCERVMIRFGSEEHLGYEEEFPIRCLKIEPRNLKFAENLTHRDFLGAIMNLGIDRSMVGDIFVENQFAIVFCQESIEPYMTEQLKQIKHTQVQCMAAETVELSAPVMDKILLSVSSARIDAVISRVYNLSRSQSMDLFRAGKIYVNGRLMENNSYSLKESDKVTARGFGRFIYMGVQGETKKGRMRVCVEGNLGYKCTDSRRL